MHSKRLYSAPAINLFFVTMTLQFIVSMRLRMNQSSSLNLEHQIVLRQLPILTWEHQTSDTSHDYNRERRMNKGHYTGMTVLISNFFILQAESERSNARQKRTAERKHELCSKVK